VTLWAMLLWATQRFDATLWRNALMQQRFDATTLCWVTLCWVMLWTTWSL
jgi:hypothetical protein